MGRPKLNLANYRAFLVDLDGVLIRSFEVLPGAPRALEQLKKMGRVIIASNNSTRSRASFADGLQKLGFAVEPEMIVHSAYIIARYLLEQAGPSLVFILGEDGLREELELAGHRMADPDRAQFVIVGLDRALTYEKLSRALRALRHGARCLATNADPTFPTPTGQIPGAGAIVGALTGMGFSPTEILGKPSRIAFQSAMQAAGVQNPRECLVIGDRLETDILGAQRMGMDSVLVLTGVTAKEDLERSELQPTWLMESIAALVH